MEVLVTVTHELKDVLFTVTLEMKVEVLVMVSLEIKV